MRTKMTLLLVVLGVVGIIALLAFSVLNGKTQAIIDDINHVSAQVMNLIKGSRQAAPPVG